MWKYHTRITQVWICFTAAYYTALQMATPSRKAALQSLNVTWSCLWWWSWCKFLLPISPLVANSATTVYLTAQLVDSPNSKWLILVRDVNFFNRLTYHLSIQYSLAWFQPMATDSKLSDYCYNAVRVSPLTDIKTKIVGKSWLLHLVLLSTEIEALEDSVLFST